MSPKISIIIPVYNAEPYLSRCIESAMQQTERNIEIICVNDSSTDSSKIILEKYKAIDKRIKVVNCSTNGGESRARNIGVAHASGEYLAFLDNDDELSLDFCNILYTEAEAKNADIVKGRVKSVGYDGKDVYSSPQIHQCISTKSKLFFADYWWSAIYKRSLIGEGISFPEGYPLGGDVFFLYRAVMAAKSVVCIDDIVYHNYLRIDSGCSLALSDEKVNSSIEIIRKIIFLLNKDKIFLIDECGYDYSYAFNIQKLINTLYRASSATSRTACCKCMLEIYDTSYTKKTLRSLLMEEIPPIVVFFDDGDLDGLELFLDQYPSTYAFAMMVLRHRVKHRPAI